MRKNASIQYTEQGSLTAAPAELLMMLWNAELKNIRIAILRIRERRPADAHNHLVRAQDIMSEFIVSLDESFGFAKQLIAMYTFVLDELVAANVRKDAERLEKLIPVVADLRDVWAGVRAACQGNVRAM